MIAFLAPTLVFTVTFFKNIVLISSLVNTFLDLAYCVMAKTFAAFFAAGLGTFGLAALAALISFFKTSTFVFLVTLFINCFFSTFVNLVLVPR